jgi:hypothetical protein
MIMAVHAVPPHTEDVHWESELSTDALEATETTDLLWISADFIVARSDMPSALLRLAHGAVSDPEPLVGPLLFFDNEHHALLARLMLSESTRLFGGLMVKDEREADEVIQRLAEEQGISVEPRLILRVFTPDEREMADVIGILGAPMPRET